MIKRCLAGVLSVLLLSPSLALAQAAKAGVVTTLEGNVTARRATVSTLVPLKFKDDVFLQDTVTTGDKALARMLLGGKAVVTVRERSVLTITEVPGRSTIELESGKFALAVAREKMRPGEEIQIRTPNAVAGVRGTVVVTEVNRQNAQVGGAAPAVLTNFYVLRGNLTAQQLDPTTRQPMGVPIQVGTLQGYSQAGNAVGRVAPVPPEQVGQIISGLSPTGPKGGSDAGQEQVKAQAVQTAVTLLSTLTGGTQGALAVAPNSGPPPLPKIDNPKNGFEDGDIIAEAVALGVASKAADAAEAAVAAADFPKIITGILTLAGVALATFNTSFTGTFTDAAVQLTNAIVTQTGADANFITVLTGGDVTLLGALLKFVNSLLTTDGKLLEIEGGKLKSTGTGALISLDPSVIISGNALIVMNGGSLTLAGPLLIDTNGVLLAAQEMVRMSNGASVTGTGTGALVQLSGTTVDASAALRMTSSSMSLAGPLASVTNVNGAGIGSAVEGPALFLLDASSITSTGTGALISFTSSEAEPNGNFLRLVNGSTLTLAGPLFSSTGGTFSSGLSTDTRAFFAVLDSSKIGSTSTSTLISFSGATFDAHGPVLNIRRSTSTSSPTKVTLDGPLFSATNSTFNTTTLGFNSTFGTTGRSCCSAFGVEQGALLESTTGSALISLSGSTFTLSDSQSGGSFFFIADTVDGFSSSELVAPATVSLAGPLLSASSSSTITPLFSLVQVNRSNLISSSTSALISLTSSTVKAGGTDAAGNATFGRMLSLFSGSNPFGTAATPATVSLAGPFLTATGSTLEAMQVMGIFGGALFTSTTTSPLISLDSTSLKLTTVSSAAITNQGDIVAVSGLGSSSGATFASLATRGGLLSVSNGSALTMTGSLANVFAGGEIIDSAPTSPFVSITGGTHTIASDSGTALLRLFGRPTATTSETVSTPGLATTTSALTLGTDQPLQRSGSGAFLELSGATVTAQKGLNIDTALLAASAPLISLKSSASLTTAADGLNLTANAKLTAVGPLVKLDGGTLTVTSGHAIRAMGGSFLNITGDLLSILNGGKLDIKNGGALFISGGSVVKISGGLVNFNNSTGTLSIASTTTCAGTCASQGGLNFLLQNGAVSGNLSITNGVKNSGSATFNVPINIPVVVLDGSTSKVIITGN